MDGPNWKEAMMLKVKQNGGTLRENEYQQWAIEIKEDGTEWLSLEPTPEGWDRINRQVEDEERALKDRSLKHTLTK